MFYKNTFAGFLLSLDWCWLLKLVPQDPGNYTTCSWSTRFQHTCDWLVLQVPGTWKEYVLLPGKVCVMPAPAEALVLHNMCKLQHAPLSLSLSLSLFLSVNLFNSFSFSLHLSLSLFLLPSLFIFSLSLSYAFSRFSFCFQLIPQGNRYKFMREEI